MIHKARDVRFFVNSGSVKTSGYSNELTHGQVALVDLDPKKAKLKKGNLVISDLSKYSKRVDASSKRFQIQYGADGTISAGYTLSDKNDSTNAFDVKHIKSVGVTAIPVEDQKQKVDEVILGFNGIETEGAITLKKGETRVIRVKLYGDIIENIHPTMKGGYEFEVVVKEEDCIDPLLSNGCVDCDPCANGNCYPIIRNAIKQIRKHKLPFSMMEVEKLIDVYPVLKYQANTPTPVLEKWFTWCLEICDAGDDVALGDVQAQYPTHTVKQVGRSGSISKYQIEAPEKDTTGTTIVIPGFTKSLGEVVKGCKACSAGLTEVPGGFAYRVVVEDGSVPTPALAEAIPHAVAGTGVFYGKTNTPNFGNYHVLASQELTDAELVTFLAANPGAEVKLVGEVDAYCKDATVTTFAWAKCGECSFTKETYEILVPDVKCEGVAQATGTRLEDLKLAYPDYNVILHHGTDNLPASGACQTRYRCTVPTNVKCDGCSPEFIKDFASEAPMNFEGISWKLEIPADAVPDGNGGYLLPIATHCGIGFRGKTREVLPTECLYNEGLNYKQDSVLISVSGADMVDTNLLSKDYYTGGYKQTQISKASEAQGRGYQLRELEDESTIYNKGIGYVYHCNKIQAYTGLGKSVINPDATYIDYWVELDWNAMAQSASQSYSVPRKFHFLVEQGKHHAVENLVNQLAAFADLDPVKA